MALSAGIEDLGDVLSSKPPGCTVHVMEDSLLGAQAKSRAIGFLLGATKKVRYRAFAQGSKTEELLINVGHGKLGMHVQ